MTIVDRARIERLQASTREAIEELRSLRSNDVAAAEAVGAAKLAAFTLEHWWLPALGELAGSEVE